MTSRTITYKTPKEDSFIFELRKKVDDYFSTNQLSKYGNINLYLKTVFLLSLYLTPYVLTVFGIITSFWAVLLCWVLIGIGHAGVGMGVMHDAVHGAYSKKSSLNKLFGNTIYLLGGFPHNWKMQHNTMHHGYTNIDGYDEDINPGSFLRFSPHKPLKKFHKYQHIYAWFLYGLMTLSWITRKDFKQLRGYQKKGLSLGNNNSYKQLFIKLSIAKALYYTFMLIIPLVFMPFAWYWVLLFFVVAHFISGLIMAVVFQTAHVVPSSVFPLPNKEGNMENDWAVHQVYTTADFAPKNKILSWLIGGLNYQIEHHLFPNISHVHYPGLAKIVRSTTEKFGLPYHVQKSFIRAIRAHGQMLKKLGKPDNAVQ